MVMTILAVSCGTGIGGGLLGLASALRRHRPEDHRPQDHRRRSGQGCDSPSGSKRGLALNGSSWSSRLALAAILAVLAGLVTRWPAAALLAACAGIGLPSLLRVTRRTNSIARTEAIALWTELLRDTLAAASGLSQSIVATASVAPDPIRTQVAALAQRLSNGMPMPAALRMFADEIGDPSADLVVCALMLAAAARAQRLVDLLGALADAMHEEVAMRLKVESGRASARSGVRTIIVFSLGFAGLLTLVARAYLAPFGSASGQIALVAAGAFDAAGIVLMTRLLREPLAPRLLLGTDAFVGLA